MSHETDNLKLEIPQPNVDPADLTIVSDNFEKVDAFAGDIATIETSPTTKAHSAGEFIIYEGRIYKVTSAISAGGSLVLGTNVSAANLGTELKSLRDSVGRSYRFSAASQDAFVLSVATAIMSGGTSDGKFFACTATWSGHDVYSFIGTYYSTSIMTLLFSSGHVYLYYITTTDGVVTVITVK